MKKFSFIILLANLLTGLAFIAHTIGGDIELALIQPLEVLSGISTQQEVWTMARCGWHWISLDLLMATVALCLLNFTNFFENPKTIMQFLSFYFFGYAVVWFIVICISPAFPNNYFKLGQWILLFFISGLIYFETKKI